MMGLHEGRENDVPVTGFMKDGKRRADDGVHDGQAA